MPSIADISSFIQRVRRQKQIKVGDGKVTYFNTPTTQKQERKIQRLQTIRHFLNTKSWNTQHVQFYEEYRRMAATFPIIKGAIDIYAEEICNKDSNNQIIKIITEDETVKKHLEELFFDNLKINSKAYLINREICKFGNVYGFLIAREKEGVTDIMFLPPETMLKEYKFYYNEEAPINEFLYRWQGSDMFEEWEIVHWKNTEDIEIEPYGQSILRPIVDTWRRVVLMREALVIHRIVRAPQRLLFKIDTTGLQGDEALAFTQSLQAELTKKHFTDPQTGELDMKYNPVSIEENLFVPTFDGSATDVTPIEGASNLNDIEDYAIIKDDLFAGLKIPKSWLTFEEDLSNKAALSEEDVRFSKTIQRHQTEFVEGLIHIAIVHLYLKGCSEQQLQSFEIEMNNPSITSELKKNELLQARLETAKQAWDASNESFNFMSYVDVLSSILKFTDEEIKKTIERQFVERKLIWKLKQINESGKTSEPDKQQANIIGLPKSNLEQIRFENEQNEKVIIDELLNNDSLKSILKEKIDSEFKELFPPIKSKASLTSIKKIQQSSLLENIKKIEKRLQ